MSEEVTSDQWSTVDSWWDTYVAADFFDRAGSAALALDSRWWDETCRETDLLWSSFTESRSLPSDETVTLGGDALDNRWDILDPWWSSYIEARRDDVADLKTTLEDSNTHWEQLGGHLNEDPLATDWGREMQTGAPLRPGIEEDWSDWLAQLLRSDTGPFHRALFREDIGTFPTVEREDYLPKTGGTDRYADIVVTTHSSGISIEVKIGDTNYGKTIDTVELIEEKYPQAWNHYLLLPEWNASVLRAGIGLDEERGEEAAESSDGEKVRPILDTEGPEHIEVIYWSDVSRALRTVLLDSIDQNPHWAASAYLFCTQIEREILGFSPKTTIDRLTTDAGTAVALESVSVAIGDLEAQNEYLTEFIEDDSNE